MSFLIMHGITLADGVTIRIGDHVWSFGMNLIIYLLVAAVVGLLAEFIVGWRLPFGIVGAIIAALVGTWLLTQVIIIQGLGLDSLYIAGVPIFKALLGAIILVALWHALTYRSWHRRRRYYYRRD